MPRFFDQEMFLQRKIIITTCNPAAVLLQKFFDVLGGDAVSL